MHSWLYLSYTISLPSQTLLSPHPHSFLQEPNHTDSLPVSGFFHRIIIQLNFGFTIQLILKSLPVGCPTFIIEIAQNTVPFLMGIVAQTTVISANTIAPSGYLHAGIPLVQVFFFGVVPKLRACSIQRPTRNSLRVPSNLSCASNISRISESHGQNCVYQSF